MRRAVAVVMSVAAAVVAVVALASPSAAHTELVQASPAPSQQVGGTVEFVDLAFFEPVSDATIELLVDGQPVEGETVVPDGYVIRFELDEPLTEPGRYDVAYHMTSFDLDQTDGGFFFTYEPSAPQPLRIGDTTGETSPSGTNLVPIIATVVLVGCLAGLAFLFLSRLQATRAAKS